MEGDWKSLLLNLGGTGPDPGKTDAGVVVLLVELEDVREAEMEEVETGSEGREGELEPGNVQEGSPTVAGALADEIATLDVAAVAVDEAEAAADCACLVRFLAAAFVCHPHEHDLSAEEVKNDP